MPDQKVKISVIDFLQQWGKYPIGHTDKNGKAICYGQTVLYGDEKYLIGYRYGDTVLKPMNSIYYLGIKNYSEVDILNEVTASEDYLIIGSVTESFIEKLIMEEVVLV